MHLVSWDVVLGQQGGLGVTSLNALQFGFNCSVIFRMYNSASPLSSWLLSKYHSPWRQHPNSATKFWKSVCKTAIDAKACFCFRITRQAPISFLRDHWCYNLTLEEYMGFGISYPDCVLGSFYKDDNWVLPEFLPVQIKNLFMAATDGEDPCLIWKNKYNSKFEDYIEEFYDGLPNCNWCKAVWHKRYCLKHNVFVWMALVRGLKTADALRIRQLVVPSKCSLCHIFDELVSHLFYECTYSFSVLNTLIPATVELFFRPSLLQLFAWVNDSFKGKASVKNFYKFIICCTTYCIWKERNSRRFGSNTQSSTTLSLTIKRVVFEKVLKWKDSLQLLESL